MVHFVFVSSSSPVSLILHSPLLLYSLCVITLFTYSAIVPACLPAFLFVWCRLFVSVPLGFVVVVVVAPHYT